MSRITELWQRLERQVQIALEHLETPEISIDATLNQYALIRAELTEDIAQMRDSAKQLRAQAAQAGVAKTRWEDRGMQAGAQGHETLAQEAKARSKEEASRHQQLTTDAARAEADVHRLEAMLADLVSKQDTLERDREVLIARAYFQQLGADVSAVNQEVTAIHPNTPQGVAQAPKDIEALERDFAAIDAMSAERRAKEKLAAMKAKMDRG